MNNTTYTRAQVTAALGTAHGQLDAVTDTSLVDHLTTGVWRRLGSGPFAAGQVLAAFSDEASELDPMRAEGVDETSDTIFAQDVLNLAVNTAAYLLDHPDATLREAIAAQYEHSTVDEVLGWVS